MYKVYKLTTNMTEELIDSIEGSMSDSDLDFVENLGADEFCFDFIENGFNGTYIICDEDILKSIKDIFGKYGGIVKETDITKEFFYGIIKIDDLAFNQYLYENITKDMILDKILELGKDSLTEMDKEILSL
jgi:hypothetical protein